MKKFVAIGCVILSTALAANAQAAQWSAGVKAGANLADLSGDDVGETSMRTGFMGGAFLQADVADEFGFRLEGLYVMKGAKEDVDLGAGPVEVTTKLDYIEFPLLFVFNLTSSETFGFNLFAGPTFAFNIGAEAEAEGGDAVDIDDAIKSFEFGAAIGAGLEYKLSSASLTFDARYSLGASSVAEDDETTGDSFDAKNRGIGLMIGLKFPLGGGAQ
jgi:Outer membrane protein beta-barrel domain